MMNGMRERMQGLVTHYLPDHCTVVPKTKGENLMLLYLQRDLLGGNMETHDPGSSAIVFKKARVECEDPDEARRVAHALNSVETNASNALEYAIAAPKVANFLRVNFVEEYKIILLRTNQAAIRSIPTHY